MKRKERGKTDRRGKLSSNIKTERNIGRKQCRKRESEGDSERKSEITKERGKDRKR